MYGSISNSVAFIRRCITSCENQQHIQVCRKMVDVFLPAIHASLPGDVIEYEQENLTKLIDTQVCFLKALDKKPLLSA